ncbi:MAG TPA: hypothetical protein VFY16_09240 [Gemmatimonadaceae bacterium]|nr:hypothetical protein [Gemmatimonadaceae bacterium]
MSMIQLRQTIRVATMALALTACGGAAASDDAGEGTTSAVTPSPAAASPTPSARAPAPTAAAGTAHVSLTGAGVSVEGDYPATRCGGPYLLGKGMAYQTRAGDWQITVASENRQAGQVPLNSSEDQVNVVVTANGPGMQLVRGPRNGGSLRVSDDFRQAEADVELRQLIGRETSRLVVTFTCE